MDPSEPPLIQRFKSWLEPAPSAEDAAREQFLTNGLVVLDTNILLSLYEYTETAREDVFTALEDRPNEDWAGTFKANRLYEENVSRPLAVYRVIPPGVYTKIV